MACQLALGLHPCLPETAPLKTGNVLLCSGVRQSLLVSAGTATTLTKNSGLLGHHGSGARLRQLHLSV